MLMAVEAFFKVLVLLNRFSCISKPLPSVVSDQMSFAKKTSLEPKPPFGQKVVRECRSLEA